MLKKSPLLPENILKNARSLRKELTPHELIIWKHLRSRRFEGFKFRRQHPIAGFIVDFCCLEAKLIVELDGGQHNLDEGQMNDKVRDIKLQQSGFRILRFWNNEVTGNLGLVLDAIYKALKNNEEEKK